MRENNIIFIVKEWSEQEYSVELQVDNVVYIYNDVIVDCINNYIPTKLREYEKFLFRYGAHKDNYGLFMFCNKDEAEQVANILNTQYTLFVILSNNII